MSTVNLSFAAAEDVPWLAQISADSMLGDRHTQMKASADTKPYDMYAVGAENLERWISRPRKAVVIKATVSTDTGMAVPAGWAAWGWQGLNDSEIDLIRTKLGTERIEAERPVPPQNPPTSSEKGEDDEKNDVVERIERHTGANMSSWMEKLMPPDSRCMFFLTCCVAPEYQGRGVGKAMIRWLNEIADQFGVYVWGHSSQDASGMYERQGYDVLGTFEVDLDAWGAKPPANEGEGAKWGIYTFSYLKREPQSREKP